MTKKLRHSVSTSKSSLLETSVTSPLCPTTNALKAKICLAMKYVTHKETWIKCQIYLQ